MRRLGTKVQKTTVLAMIDHRGIHKEAGWEGEGQSTLWILLRQRRRRYASSLGVPVPVLRLTWRLVKVFVEALKTEG